MRSKASGKTQAPLGKYAAIGLLMILVTAVCLEVQAPGENGYPEPANKMFLDVRDGYEFNFTMIDSAWFDDMIIVDISFIAADVGDFTMTLAFSQFGSPVTQIVWNFDISFGIVTRESGSETISLQPGFYDLEFSSTYDTSHTLTLEQHGIDARDEGQRIFDTTKGLLFFAGLGFGGMLILYVAFSGFSYSEPKIRRKDVEKKPEMYIPKTVICAGCGEAVYVQPDIEGVSTCPLCGKRQIV